MTTREQIKAARDAMPKWQTVSENLIAPPTLKINWWQPHEPTLRALLSGDIAALRAAVPDTHVVVERGNVQELRSLCPEGYAVVKKAKQPIAGLAKALEHEFTDAEVSEVDDVALATLWKAAKRYHDEHSAEKGNG